MLHDRRPVRAVGALALLLVTACAGGSATADPARPSAGHLAPSLHVAGNQLVDAHDQPVVLHGVNRSGPEFACHPPSGFGGRVFDGPSDDDSVAAIASWTGVNTVRVPLNEDCWLGLKGAEPAASGPAYQRAIRRYVQTLHRHGLVAILDLHWTDGVDKGTGVGCPDFTAACQKPMPDLAHAPEFWSSVAQAFRSDLATVFDLFNEPFPDVAHALSKEQAWLCWQQGGASCPGFSFTVAGMQSLVNAVRDTGARNVVMLGGLSWSLDLTGWLIHRPTDATGNTIASWHIYNFNGCAEVPCWTTNIVPLVRVVPVVTGEIGEDDCEHVFVDQLMPWLDSHGVSYLGWTWSTYASCKGHPILITDYKGTPTAFGVGIKRHLAQLSRG